MGPVRFVGVVVVALCLAGSAALAHQNNERQEREAREDRNDRGSPEYTRTVRTIAVDTEGKQVLLTSVIILTNTDKVLGVPTGIGVRRVDENRLDLGGVPLIGGLFDDGDRADSSAPSEAIGVSYFIGGTLAVDLRDAAPPAGAGAPASDAELAAAGVEIETRLHSRSGNVVVEIGLRHDRNGREITLDGFRVLNQEYSYYIPGTEIAIVGRMVESTDQADGDGKIPIIGDLPLLRGLFSRPAGTAYLQGRDLVVLIKPSILDDEYE